MLIVYLGKWGWNKYKTHKELKVEEKNEIETIKETSAKDYAENLLNEADKDDEIVDIIIDEDGSIITVDFPKDEFEGYCRVGLIYTLH